MKIIPFQPPVSFLHEADAEYVRRVFENGGVVAFPSDTCYGLAVDPRQRTAVEKMYKIKDRCMRNAVSCIFSTIEEAKKWARIGKNEEQILRTHLPGAFTFILSPTSEYPLDGAVGVRIPDSDLTRGLSLLVGTIYTATSANVSGNSPLYTAKDVKKEFKHTLERPDIILDAGPLIASRISTVIDLTGDMPKTIRKGSGRFLSV